MWLPKDERRLLSLYFHKIDKPNKQETLKDFDDLKALGWKESKSNDNYDKQYANRVWNADDILKERGFIDISNRVFAEKTISLTIRGYDLGRKYNSWWSSSGLWFAEYKDHWFWLILSFLGGIIGALIVNWLSK